MSVSNFACVFTLLSIVICLAVAQNGPQGPNRVKRGAAVYRTFPNRPSSGHRSFSESNPQAFVNYLGSSGGGGGGSYGGGGSSPPGLGLNYGGSSNLASRYAQSGYGSSSSG